MYVEGNCIEISTSIYSCVHSNTLIYKPNIDWLVVYHLLWPALGGSMNGCVNYQTHWCWLRTAKMPLQRMWPLFVRQCQVQHWATWGHFDRVYILYQCNTITSYDHDNPLHKPHFSSQLSQILNVYEARRSNHNKYTPHHFPCIHLNNNFWKWQMVSNF